MLPGLTVPYVGWRQSVLHRCIVGRSLGGITHVGEQFSESPVGSVRP
jgi:hypothetical protein